MPSSSTASGHRQRASLSSATRRSALTSLSSHQTRLGDPFEPCAATATYFLYAQHNIIRCLHHDTLAIERKFERHTADVLLIYADNISERGAGRLVVSYDAEQTAIIWDLLTGDEVARFASYEVIRVAAWLKDGTIAFGNCHGNIILFDPSSSEHVSARTIFDPITALAPASDCSTYAIGYQNGSILIATLQPSFTIIHTLSTPRIPSPVTGLGWHNSSSKQKTEMLATQTTDGDLRIWSVAKVSASEPPRMIRVLEPSEHVSNPRSWFTWSKNGRIVQCCNGDTRVWDVRTKKTTSETVPTIDDVLAIAAFGPSGTVFTVGRNYSVQQYDLLSQGSPIMVKNVQHAVPNAPPTPPDLIDESKRSRTVPVTILPDEPIRSNQYAQAQIGGAETREEEDLPLSPLQKIARRDRSFPSDENRDQLGGFSPISSRGSESSASSHGARRKRHPGPPKPVSESDGSCLSTEPSVRSGNDNTSIRSGSSISAQRHGASALRFEVMRSPEEQSNTKFTELFPFVKARLSEVKFRTPRYGQTGLTPEVLRKEMLRVVFGWDDDIESLIRDEQSRHQPGTASSVLLSKWLGDLGADNLAQMIGSESMTSSDWMLLALSCQMGEGSQKKVGEAFVKRLLETGEVHPAVAILLGLGDLNEAVEVYVSRQMYLEAVLLTCLVFSNDWIRQSHLVRRWGENAVSNGQAELAVRCFSCTTLESSEPWFSPRSTDAVYQAQQRALAPQTLSPPISPPPSTAASRITAKTASLRLITQFNQESEYEDQYMRNAGVTPIVDSALTPSIASRLRKDPNRNHRDRSQSRTATPGGAGRNRLPSTKRELDGDLTPLGPSRVQSRLATPAVNRTGTPASAVDTLRTPIQRRQSYSEDPARRARAASTTRSGSRNRNGLQLAMAPVVEAAGGLKTGVSSQSNSESVTMSEMSADRSIDRYIDSLDSASNIGSQHIASQYSRARSQSSRVGRSSRSRSRARDINVDVSSEGKVTNPSQPSPTSPVPMTADEVGTFTTPDVNQSAQVRDHPGSLSAARGVVDYSAAWSGSPDSRSRQLDRSDTAAQAVDVRDFGAQVTTELTVDYAQLEAGLLSPTKIAEDYYRQPAVSIGPTPSLAGASVFTSNRRSDPAVTAPQIAEKHFPAQLMSPLSTVQSEPFSFATRPMTRKELAAQELEERRLSLARRPSVPNIPHPAEISASKVRRSPRKGTDPFPMGSPAAYADAQAIARSQTVGPEFIYRQPQPGPTRLGLPATPKAMRSNPGGADKDSYFQQKFTPVVLGVPVMLAPVSYQPAQKPTTTFGPLLPSTVYSHKPPITRSASAPPEQFQSARRLSNDSPSQRLHMRKGSAIDVIPEVSASFEAGLHDHDERIIVVSQSEPATWSNADVREEEEEDEHPPILAELAHLAGPPPPPPPPTMFRPISSTSTSGIIEVVMDDEATGRTSTTTPTPPPPPASHFAPVTPVNSPPSMINRHRTPGNDNFSNSGSNATTPTTGGTGGGIGSKFRNVAERIRSSSRNRARSPPSATQDIVSPFSATTSPAPYETITGPPPASYFQQQHYGGVDRRTSFDGYAGAGSPPPSKATTGGYRHPKEIAREYAAANAASGSDAARYHPEWAV